MRDAIIIGGHTPKPTYKDLEQQTEALLAQIEELKDRIKDILMGDDGQAFKEAEKALERLQK